MNGLKHSTELLKYHPNRYVQSRSFFRPLFNQFRQSADVNGVLPASAFKRICDKLIFEYWNPELDRFPVEQRSQNPTQLIVSEQSMFTHVAQFTLSGRNIFHFSRTLIALLRLTDVDDVMSSSISLPYPAFYIWFGTQQELRFGNGHYCIDGAYVSSIPNGGIQFLVTTIEPGIDYAHPPSFAIHRDFYYYTSFQFTDERDTVGAALARTLGTDAMFQRGFQPLEIEDETTRLAEESGISISQTAPTETAQAKTVEERIGDLPVFKQVLKLLINGLCYLSSPSREVCRKYPESICNTPGPLAKRETQRLRREGYTEINFCGESFDREYSSVLSGKELCPHWRRGHWRNQAHGPMRKDHRLMWIRPTLVRKDKQGDEVVGHVYQVE